MREINQILISALNARDSEAYAKLYDMFYKELCTYVFNYVRCMHMAEDVVQETFIRIWNSETHFTLELSVKSYLYRSAYHTAIDYINHKIKEEELKSNLLLNAKLLEEQNNTGHIHEEEMEHMLTELIERIPQHSRHVLKLSRYKGLKHKDIAKQLNITVKGVEYHISKALRYLEKELINYYKAM